MISRWPAPTWYRPRRRPRSPSVRSSGAIRTPPASRPRSLAGGRSDDGRTALASLDWALTPDPLTLPSPPLGERGRKEESSVVRVLSSLSPAAGERAG